MAVPLGYGKAVSGAIQVSLGVGIIVIVGGTVAFFGVAIAATIFKIGRLSEQKLFQMIVVPAPRNR